MARNSTGVVRAASQLDVISPLRNLFPSYSVKKIEGDEWIRQEMIMGLSPSEETLQQLTLTFTGWVTPPSLCVKHQLCVHKYEVMLWDKVLVGPFSWGKGSLTWLPLRFWLPSKTSSLLCLYLPADLQNVSGRSCMCFLVLGCLEQAVTSPAIFCGLSA